MNTKDVSFFLEQKGIETSPTAIDFLRVFHGLRILSPDGGISEANFDVFEAVKFLEENEIAHLERILGQSLCPVGLGGRFLFFITPTQDMYLLQDEWFEYLHIVNVHDFFELIVDPSFNTYETIVLSDDEKPVAFRDTD